jgi:lipid-A-disaccharide synthase
VVTQTHTAPAATPASPPTVFFVAGEASGDAHAAHVAEALRALRPGLRLRGVGGERMRQAGVELVFDSSHWGAIGLVESLRVAPRLVRIGRQLKEHLLLNRPLALVLVDFGAFNVRLARWAHGVGIPTLYYFPPGSWNRRRRRSALPDLVDAIATPFPWSRDALTGGHARVEWVGHPFAGSVRPTMTPEQARAAYGIEPQAPVVALCPGSRQAEIRYHLPPLLATAEGLAARHPEMHFLVPVAATVDRPPIERELADRGLRGRLLEGMEYDALQLARVALVSSGTATLELACLGVPMVVIYRASFWIEYLLLYPLWRPVTMFGMPNLIAQRFIVPELRQGEVNAETMTAWVERLLPDGVERERMRRELVEVAAALGAPGADRRTAEMTLSLIDSAS